MDQLSTKVTKFPSAPALEQPSPNGTFVKDRIYLALRQAQIGQPSRAAKLLSDAKLEVEKIPEGSAERGYWDGQLKEAILFANALDSPEQTRRLQAAAGQADAVYVRNQKLRPEEIAAFTSDNADTQRALDDQAAGLDPNWRYGASTVEKAAGNAAGAVSGAIAGIAGAALAPWKLAIYFGLAIGTFLLAGYGVYYVRTAKAVAGKVV